MCTERCGPKVGCLRTTSSAGGIHNQPTSDRVLQHGLTQQAMSSATALISSGQRCIRHLDDIPFVVEVLQVNEAEACVRYEDDGVVDPACPLCDLVPADRQRDDGGQDTPAVSSPSVADGIANDLHLGGEGSSGTIQCEQDVEDTSADCESQLHEDQLLDPVQKSIVASSKALLKKMQEDRERREAEEEAKRVAQLCSNSGMTVCEHHNASGVHFFTVKRYFVRGESNNDVNSGSGSDVSSLAVFLDIREPMVVNSSRKLLGTGTRCWTAAVLFGRWIATEEVGKRWFQGRNVLEIGAGCNGLPGLCASLHAASVILSDCVPELVDILQQNVAANQSHLASSAMVCGSRTDLNDVKPCTIAAKIIDWSQCSDCNIVNVSDSDSQHQQQHGAFDVVIGADIIYGAMDPSELVSAVSALLNPGKLSCFMMCMPDSSQSMHQGKVDAVGSKVQANEAFGTRGNALAFLNAMTDAGFRWSIVEQLGEAHDGFYENRRHESSQGAGSVDSQQAKDGNLSLYSVYCFTRAEEEMT